MFQGLPGISIVLGLAVIISKCVGAGDYVQAEYYKRKVSRIIHITNACFSAAVIVLMPLLMKLYDLSAQATHYVWIIVLAHGILVSLFGILAMFYLLSFVVRVMRISQWSSVFLLCF